MSEDENKFQRSEVGHDAGDLHGGGRTTHEGNNSEREDLEEAIRDLENDDIDVEEEKVEVKVSPTPPLAKPIAEEQEFMTIDSVKEPKSKDDDKCHKCKKSRATGWKIATSLLFILCVGACGALVYLFTQEGSFVVLGRRISSIDEKKYEQQQEKEKRQQEEIPPAILDESYVKIEEAGFEVKLDESNYNMSYTYTAATESEPAKVKFWLSMKSYETIPDFADPTKNEKSMGVIYIYNTDPTLAESANISNAYALAPDKYLVWEYSDAVYSTEEADIQKESECSQALQASLNETNIRIMQ